MFTNAIHAALCTSLISRSCTQVSTVLCLHFSTKKPKTHIRRVVGSGPDNGNGVGIDLHAFQPRVLFVDLRILACWPDARAHDATL